MPVKHTHIGGQAVLEGVMMRGKSNWAVAVREPDGSIHLEAHELKTAVTEHPWLGKPIIRGIWGMYETLVLAMKAFGISAEHAGETEEEKLTSKEIAFTMVAGVGLAVALFIVLPAVLTNVMVGQATEKPFTWNVVDGALRVVAFFAYIWAISRMRDIQRVFSYHGAEHKTIHAYENDVPLEVSAIQKFTTMHVRCGTSFLLMVMIIAIIVFSVVPVKPIVAAMGVDGKMFTLLVAISLRIILMPLIAGLAYEVIKWAGNRSNSPLVKVLLWPGLQLQRMTTREPEDEMIEVAVASMKAVIAREEGREVNIREILGLPEEADEDASAADAPAEAADSAGNTPDESA